MRRLFLHIGHGKTGSSFLQSSFANSIDVLAQHGIGYPQAPNRQNASAEDWQISSGNGDLLLRMPPDQIPVEHERILFSSEQLFQQILEASENIDRITAFCTHHAVSEVHILLFLRDPIPHAESTYQQLVKRGGATFDVAQVFETYRMPELTRWILTLAIGDIPIKWHIHNFDRNRAGLVPIAERFLGLPPQTLATGGGRVVNRSMTAAEIAFLREMNGQDARLAQRIADALCNELPDIPAEPIFPSVAVQKAMLRAQADAIAEVNARLPETERYATELRLETPVDGNVTFSHRQVAVIARVLGEELARQSAQNAKLIAQNQISRAKVLAKEGQKDEARQLLMHAKDALIKVDGDAMTRNVLTQAENLLEELGAQL